MYTPLYNRICGWVFFALGLLGLTSGRLGSYMFFTTGESCYFLIIGVTGMLAARIRHRESTLLCIAVAAALLTTGLYGLFIPEGVFGTAQPLESALQVVAGGWGLYAAGTDVWSWVRALIHS